MRDAFIRALTEAAGMDERVNLIVGDLGFRVVDDFAAKFPDRFLNPGVAEQNMTGIAAGMALSGKIVFTYSIANFPTLRCLEQIRNDVCYHDVNVNIVAVGGGFAYGILGMTHFATEDLAIMRALPNMTVLAPGDPVETMEITRQAVKLESPCYIRLGKAGEPVVHEGRIDLQIGRALELKSGTDIALLSTGGMLKTAVETAALLDESGHDTGVFSFHTVKPLDEHAVWEIAGKYSAIFTLEEHSVLGGFGGAVAEVLAESGQKVTFRRFGLPSEFSPVTGSQNYLRDYFGLTADKIAGKIRKGL